MNLRITSLLGLCACLTGVTFAANETEWTTLFNGRDLSGFTVKCKPADQAKTFWKVQDGAIVADSMGSTDHDYVWLLTNSEYSDFVLRLKFQAFRNSPGNTGIQIRSRYDDKEAWLDGPQVDLNPPGTWRNGMMWDETRNNLRWIYPDLPLKIWVKPEQATPNMKFFYNDEGPGWNELEITAHGTKVKAVLNGVLVTDYDGKGVLDDENHKKFGVGMNGHIALQIHTKNELLIKFKDIQIKSLAP